MKRPSTSSAASLLAALSIIAIVAVAACGKTTGIGNINPVTPVTSAVVQPVTAAVTIDGYAFHPKTVKIKIGTTVKWTNHQNIDHTVTANNGSFSSKHIAPGTSYSHKFTKAGKIGYHCMIHPFMHGTVVVSR